MSIHHHLECGDDFLFLDKDAQKLYFKKSSCFRYFWHNRTESSSTVGWQNPQFCDLLFDIFLS